jgi:hypothetical protein
MPFDNILEFVEGSAGLHQTLFPVQRFILKMYYGIELDNSNHQIQIYDRFQEWLRYSMTEVDYLNYLYGEGRCNISSQPLLRPGLVLAAGRRTGKSTLAHLISSYTVIQMLQAGNPHALFGLPTSQLLVAACYIGFNRGRNQLLSHIDENIARCEELREYFLTRSNRDIRFWTPEGRRLGLDRGNLAVTVLDSRPRIHAIPRGALIIDELAHMPEEREIYISNIQTIRTIRPPGRYLIMSTPRRAEGEFYNQFRYAMGNHHDSPLALQIPTWEVQPADRGPLLRQRFEENPTQFDVEYGTQWQHIGRRVQVTTEPFAPTQFKRVSRYKRPWVI